MELLLHDVFLMYWDTYCEILKSISWMKNTQKHFESIVTSVFKQ
jgi:hypothetical protein